MPFGYLEFSRTIRGKPCPHARAAAAAAAGRGAGAEPSSGSGSLPGPVLFELGLTGMGYHGLYRIQTRINAMAVSKPSRTVGRLLSEMNGCNGSDRTVATVRLGTDHFTPPGAL